MLLSFGLPDYMWGEALLSATHILNRVPHKKLDKTPYELWKGFAPNQVFVELPLYYFRLCNGGNG